MVNAQRKALERLWKDRCTVYHRVKVKDPISKLTDSKEMPLLQDSPVNCLLKPYLQQTVIMFPRWPNL